MARRKKPTVSRSSKGKGRKGKIKKSAPAKRATRSHVRAPARSAKSRKPAPRKPTRIAKAVPIRQDVRKATKDWDRMLRAVRGDAHGFEAKDGFKFGKMTAAQKRKVERAFLTVSELAAKPHKVVAPRSAKKQRELQRAALPEVDLKLKRVRVPVAHPKTAKVRVSKRGEIEIEQAGLKSRDVLFDVKALLKDPEAEIERALRGVKGDKFHILAGDRLAHNFSILDRGALARTVTMFMNEYGTTKGEHAVGEWLKGVRVYDGTLAQFRRATMDYMAENEEGKALRRMARSRQQSRRARIKGRR